jgi:hypothetical protein
MPEENDPNNQGGGDNNGKYEWVVQVLKVLGITVAAIVLLAVLAFGLLVGFCALSSRH